MTYQGAAAPPIVQYWHSPNLPPEVAELTATFRDANPALRHLVFCEASADEFIAEHLGARELAAFRACAVPAMQADYLRYCAPLVLGGTCSDVDYRCVGPLATLVGLADGGGVLFRGHLGQVINGFFSFGAPGHPLLRLALDVATANIELRSAESVWSVTGPWIFTALCELHRLGSPDELRRKAAQLSVKAPLEQLLEVACDRARILTAFEGVRVLSFEQVARRYIGGPGIPLPYKSSDLHWVRWQEKATIFRS